MDFDLSKKHCFYFNEISMIPRGSGNERAISDYVAGFAEKHGFDYVQDDILNVIVHKPASDGYEDHGPVMLQAHRRCTCIACLLKGAKYDTVGDAGCYT